MIKEKFSQPSRPAGFFITGTDTDVGKTYATGCIGLSLLQQGLKVSPRKPIASGCILQADGTLLSEDALYIQQACLSSESLQTICPNTFEPAISPQRALKQANRLFTTQMLAKACDKPTECFALVEGAGGFYSPISSDGLNADLAKTLGYPVVLVIGNRLGCINSALLTIEAIKRSKLSLHSIIINDISKDADIENVRDIQALVQAESIQVFHLKYNATYTAQPISGFVL